VTAGMPQKVSGSAQVSGKLNIKDSIVSGDFAVTAPSLKFQDGHCEKLNAAIKLSKKMPPAGSDKPWFDNLVSETTLAISNVRFRDYLADSVEGSLRAKDDLVTFDRLSIRRKENEFAVSGDYRLPKELRDVAEQPAKI